MPGAGAAVPSAGVPSAGVAAGVASVVGAGAACSAGWFLEQVKPVVKERASKAAITIAFIVVVSLRINKCASKGSLNARFCFQTRLMAKLHNFSRS